MSVLIKPLVTEKTTSESELRNRYTFLVHPKANKVEIKKAVEATYGVTSRLLKEFVWEIFKMRFHWPIMTRFNNSILRNLTVKMSL